MEAGEHLDPDAHFGQCRQHGERTRRDPVERQCPDDQSGAEWEANQKGRHLTATKTIARTASDEAIASAYVRRSPVWRRANSPPTSRVSVPSSVLPPRISGRSTTKPSARATNDEGTEQSVS